MRSHSWKSTTVAALSLAACSVGAGASASAAAERGTPPPAGKVAPEWDLWSYRGQLIARDDAARKGLGCVEDGVSRPRCYDTRAELDDAENIASPKMYADRAAAAKSAAKKARPHVRRPRGNARRANHYGDSAYPLIVYQHSGFAGWYVVANSYCTWFNLTGFYNDAVSSLVAGQHTGFMSWDAGGNGAIYTIGAWAQHNYVGSTWNDQASARSRTCL